MWHTEGGGGGRCCFPGVGGHVAPPEFNVSEREGCSWTAGMFGCVRRGFGTAYKYIARNRCYGIVWVGNQVVDGECVFLKLKD